MLPVRSSPVYRPLLFVMEQFFCQATLFIIGIRAHLEKKKVSLLKHLILSKSHFTNYPSHTYSFPSYPIFSFPLTFQVLSHLQDIAHAKAGFQHVRYMMLYEDLSGCEGASSGLAFWDLQSIRKRELKIETSCTNNHNRVALIRNIPSRTLLNKKQSCLSIYFPLCYITS